MTYLRFDHEQEWLAALLADWQTVGSEALRLRGAFNVALCGGATPEPFYRALGEIDWPWSATRLFIGDERMVPQDARDSNYRMIYQALYPLKLNLERWKTELLKAEDTAADYERRMIRDLGRPPRFDLVLLGIGADGHTAALFPGTKALSETEKYAVANRAPQAPAQRLTLTYPTLYQAKAITFLAKGPDKQPLIDRMSAGTQCDFPAGTVTSERGEIKIFYCAA